MTYWSAVWRAPAELKDSPKTIESRLSVVQKKCLRMVSGAHKATPIQALEAETYVFPISLHLNQPQAKSRYRMRSVVQTRLFTKACKITAAKLENTSGPQRSAIATPGHRKQAWAQSLIENAPFASTQPLPVTIRLTFTRCSLSRLGITLAKTKHGVSGDIILVYPEVLCSTTQPHTTKWFSLLVFMSLY